MPKTKQSFIMLNLALFCLLFNLSNQIVFLRDQLNYQTGTNYVGVLPKTKQSLCDTQTDKYQSTKTQQFDQQQQKQSCYSPRVFNPETSSCQCLYGTIYYPTKNQCLCPTQKPLWTGNNCIQCPFKISSTDGKVKCSLCPQGFIAKQNEGNIYCQGTRVK